MSGRKTKVWRGEDEAMAVNFYRFILLLLFFSVGYLLSAEREINQNYLLIGGSDQVVQDQMENADAD